MLPKTHEIAARIAKHLHRMEMAQPNRGSRDARYWKTNAYPAGNRVAVWYVVFNGAHKLTKDEALAYLLWLDAGNEGKHHEMPREVGDAE